MRAGRVCSHTASTEHRSRSVGPGRLACWSPRAPGPDGSGRGVVKGGGGNKQQMIKVSSLSKI